MSGRREKRRVEVAAAADCPAGAISGIIATVPMTAVMLLLSGLLPQSLSYPLPPRLITDRLTHAKPAVRHGPGLLHPLTLIAHFGFGAAMGCAYAAAVPARQANPTSGCAFGMLVWAASYLGWIPAAGLLSPATRHPPPRTAIMIAAHAAWGMTLGHLVAREYD